MNKKIVCGLLAALLLAGMTACGEKPETPAQPQEIAEPQPEQPQETEQPEQPEEPAPAPVELATVREDILTQLDIADSLPLETEALLDLYGVSAEQVRQSASFVTMSGTFPDEVILVEAVDEAAAEAVAECLQNRLNEVLVQSETYDPENYQAAQNCRVRQNGLYVALILSPMEADMAAVYESYVN